MGKWGKLKQRVTKFIHLFFFQVAAVVGTLLTILSFVALGTVVFGFIKGLIDFVLFGLGVLFVSGLLYIVHYSILAEKSEHEQTTMNTSLTGEKKVASTSHPIDTIEYPPPPKAKNNKDNFSILKKVIVYEYSADGKTIYQRKYMLIQVLRDNLILYTDRYHWTGNGKCIVRSLTPEFEITNQHEREEEEATWSYFNVRFPHHYHKEDIIESTIEWELEDAEKKAVPFLSTMIDYETNYLFLQVILPHEMAPKRAYLHKFEHYKDTLPSVTRQAQWSSASRSIMYEVPEPKKDHKYAIRWYEV
jgi:hypothetical protein